MPNCSSCDAERHATRRLLQPQGPSFGRLSPHASYLALSTLIWFSADLLGTLLLASSSSLLPAPLRLCSTRLWQWAIDTYQLAAAMPSSLLSKLQYLQLQPWCNRHQRSWRHLRPGPAVQLDAPQHVLDGTVQKAATDDHEASCRGCHISVPRGG